MTEIKIGAHSALSIPHLNGSFSEFILGWTIGANGVSITSNLWMRLHGTVGGDNYQLLSTPDLNRGYWDLGEILFGASDGQADFSLSAIIAPHELEKSPVFRLIEIVGRFCSMADFSGTNLRDGCQKHEPNKAFHNPALCAAAIPNLPANPCLCSNRAVEVLRRGLPATSLFLCVVFSPARRPNFLEHRSRSATLTKSRRYDVFTYTQ